VRAVRVGRISGSPLHFAPERHLLSKAKLLLSVFSRELLPIKRREPRWSLPSRSVRFHGVVLPDAVRPCKTISRVVPKNKMQNLQKCGDSGLSRLHAAGRPELRQRSFFVLAIISVTILWRTTRGCGRRWKTRHLNT